MSLETARKLEEAGFPQTAERSWVSDEYGWHIENVHENDGPDYSALEPEDYASAPDAQEMRQELPMGGWKGYRHPSKGFVIGTVHNMTSKRFEDESEAEAHAAYWLWLKENNSL